MTSYLRPVLILIFLFGLNAKMAHSQFGILDPSFGSGGIVTTPVATAYESGRAVALQSDGKIVVAGRTHNGSNYDMAAIRYNSDGSLDLSFGTGGKVILDPTGIIDQAYAVAIQTDGKIIMGGFTGDAFNSTYCLVRLKTNGDLDSTFGTNGIVVTSFGGSNAQCNSLVLQSDGKIIAAGQANISGYFKFALARYESNGTLDPGFGTGGIVATTLPGSGGAIRSAKLQPDGKIIAAGNHLTGFSDNNFAIARYNTDGSLDTNFATSGMNIHTIDSATTDYCYGVALQSTGKIVAVGSSFSGVNSDFVVTRYDSDGILDNSFGTGGILLSPIGFGYDEAYCVSIQPDDKILAGGFAHIGAAHPDLTVVRYDPNGTFDNSFGSAGVACIPLSSNASKAWAMVIQPDQRIVAVGDNYNGTDEDFGATRLISTNLGMELSGENNFIVYPVPTNGIFKILTTTLPEHFNMYIFDMAGKTVYVQNDLNESEMTFNISHLTNGIYFVHLVSSQRSIVMKVIKS